MIAQNSIERRKKLIFHSDVIENNFMELTSPRSGIQIKWRKGELIGEGAYAKVYQCINLATGELLAVKSFTVFFI
jgi:serine/threonine protein kinase